MKFEEGMKALQESLDSTSSSVNGTDDINEKIRILEEGILNQ